MPIETVLMPAARDLGDGVVVKRALPSAQRAAVACFVFFDQMGPVRFQPRQGMDVRPHPHIGLAAVTYLFEGELMHRDSLGHVQLIRPGEVNWMNAGRGIVHSERTPPAARASGASLFGLQIWLALPKEQEESAPSFTHYDAAALPVRETGGVRLRLLAGSLQDMRAPAGVGLNMFYADLELLAGADLVLEDEHAERAVYVTQGTVQIDDHPVGAASLALLRTGGTVRLRAAQTARAMLLGGAPLDGPRRVWWNFVSSSVARIEKAKADWREDRIGTVPGESDRIELPD